MLLPTYSLILIINNSTEKKLIFPFSDEETDIHTMLKWQLAFKHGSVSTVYALDSRNGWGSQSRKLTKLSLGLASLSSKAEEHTIVAQISFGSFIINREHSIAEFANSLSQQTAAEACQRTGLQTVSSSSMTNKNSLHPSFVTMSPQSRPLAAAFLQTF